jgi:hypothetical protein
MTNQRILTDGATATAVRVNSTSHKPISKGPGDLTGPFNFMVGSQRARSLRGFFGNRRLFLGVGLGTASRTLGKGRLDLLDRLGLGDPLDRRDLA